MTTGAGHWGPGSFGVNESLSIYWKGPLHRGWHASESNSTIFWQNKLVSPVYFLFCTDGSKRQRNPFCPILSSMHTVNFIAQKDNVSGIMKYRPINRRTLQHWWSREDIVMNTWQQIFVQNEELVNTPWYHKAATAQIQCSTYKILGDVCPNFKTFCQEHYHRKRQGKSCWHLLPEVK